MQNREVIGMYQKLRPETYGLARKTEQNRKKLVSWIMRNNSKNVTIEEHFVKITKNFVAFM